MNFLFHVGLFQDVSKLSLTIHDLKPIYEPHDRSIILFAAVWHVLLAKSRWEGREVLSGCVPNTFDGHTS